MKIDDSMVNETFRDIVRVVRPLITRPEVRFFRALKMEEELRWKRSNKMHL